MQVIAIIQAWALAHPALVVLLWPLATAIVNLVFGEAEKYAKTHPRAHAALAFIESAGFDARGTIDALAKLFKGTPKGAGVALVLACIGWGCALATACTKQQASDFNTNVAPSGAQCIEDIVADVSGAIDIPGTILHCGVSIDQLIAYLENYFSKDAGAAGAGPAKVERVGKMLEAARSYKAHGS